MNRRKPPMNRAARLIFQYLDEHSMTQAELAAKLDVCPGALGDYVRSRTCPSLFVALKIEDYFQGEVPARSWLEAP